MGILGEGAPHSCRDDLLYRPHSLAKAIGFSAAANMTAVSCRDKPVANTSVMEWEGKLYALWEADNPTILDPTTLETLGAENFGKSLRGL